MPANIERVAISGPISQMFMLTLCPEKLVGLSNALSDDEIEQDAISTEILNQQPAEAPAFPTAPVQQADPTAE